MHIVGKVHEHRVDVVFVNHTFDALHHFLGIHQRAALHRGKLRDLVDSQNLTGLRALLDAGLIFHIDVHVGKAGDIVRQGQLVDIFSFRCQLRPCRFMR